MFAFYFIDSSISDMIESVINRIRAKSDDIKSSYLKYLIGFYRVRYCTDVESLDLGISEMEIALTGFNVADHKCLTSGYDKLKMSIFHEAQQMVGTKRIQIVQNCETA